MRIADGDDGTWRIQIAPPGLSSADYRRIDAAGLDRQELQQLIDAAADRLDPHAGRIVQAVWLDTGTTRPGRLLLMIHHLAVDGVSWRILIPDLQAAWEQAAAGAARIVLPPVGTSFRFWAHRLFSQAPAQQLPFWTEMLQRPNPPLFRRPLDPRRDTAATAKRLSLTLPPALTAPLLTSVPAAFHGKINDVLLAALVLAVGRALVLDIEGHGREDADGIDVSRTVGWFTTLYPVLLDPGPGNFDDAVALGRAVKLIKEQLRAVPENGLGYGLLRYLDPEGGRRLSSIPGPELSFNYLGRFPAGASPPYDWAVAPEMEGLGSTVNPAAPFAHALELNAVTLDREEAGPELVAIWSWPGALLTEDEVRDLAERWFRVLAALVRDGAGGRTPSDLPLVALAQADIEFGRAALSRWNRRDPAAVAAAGRAVVPVPRRPKRVGGRLRHPAIADAARPAGPAPAALSVAGGP